MTAVRKVLIADPDLASARALSKDLRKRGYQVHYAADGARALELAVLRHPDVVLFDQACPFIEPGVFAQILKTNPRTEGIPVILTAANPGATAAEPWLHKPLELGEVLARIEEILSRPGAESAGEAQELEGSFGQLPLPDLLQMLKLNRRSGRLEVSRGTEQGAVVVAEGRPVDASVGTVSGEKALFRLLTWKEGNFGFVPGAPPSVARISRGMDDALLEGVRQADELARLEPSLPARTAWLVRAAGTRRPFPVDTLERSLLELLGEPHALATLLDRHPATDLAVLQGVARLLRHGMLQVTEPELRPGSGPLLGPAEIHALRARMLRGRPGARTVVAKVLVCGHGAERTRRLLAQLPSLVAGPEEVAALEGGFGTVARLELGEGLRLDFCVLPSADAARPLWHPFSAGAVGVLVLDAEEDTLALAAALARQLRLRVVCVGLEVPFLLARAPGGAATVAGGADLALRALLVPEFARTAASEP
jgi:CheY-like chemotaxis protein